MPKRTSPFRDDLLKDLRDPAYATDYMVACAIEGGADIAVRDIIDSAKLAERARCEKLVATVVDRVAKDLGGGRGYTAALYLDRAVQEIKSGE